MKRKLPKSGEIYAYYIEDLEKYGAFQILKVEGKNVCYVSLDCLTDHLPQREEVLGWKPLYWERYRFHHRVDIGIIELTPLPPSYQCLGEFPLVTEKSSKDFFGRRWPDGSAYVSEIRWKSLDEKVTAAYKKYVNSGEEVVIHGKIFPKRLDVLRDDLYQHLNEQDSLEQFPCINVARVEGFSPKLLKLIKTSPLLTKLELKNPGVSALDLRGTGLEDMELDITGVKRLSLPEEVRGLVLYGNLEPELIIDDSACDEKQPPIFLWIFLKKAQVSRYGMQKLRVKKLVLYDILEIDVAEAAKCFPDLKELCMKGCPGIVKNMKMLGRLEELQVLSLEELFGFDVEFLEGIGQLPMLRDLSCESIPKDVGIEIKRQQKGKIDILSVTKLRDEDWLKENLDNPLRHWDGSEFVPPAAYKKAFQCYKDTKRQMLEAVNRQEILRIVQAYTKQINQLNEKYEEFIETEEREDIFAAMKQLYEDCLLKRVPEGDIIYENRLNITLEEIYDAMDEVRGDW